MKLKQLIKEHAFTRENKNEVAYYYKTIKSQIEAAKDLANNYGTSDNINMLDQAMDKLDIVIDEANNFKKTIQNIAKEHYKQK
jgi:fructose-1,6-bisphosphatase